MFISRKRLEGIETSLAELRAENSKRTQETHRNAERIHEYSVNEGKMSLEVRDELGDPIMGIGHGAQHIRRWVDMRDIIRAIADKIGFELVYKQKVDGHPVVIDASAKQPGGDGYV